MSVLLALLLRFFLSRRSYREIALENVALRQQLVVMKRQCPRPRVRTADRIFWVWLSTVWSHWRQALMIVRPETVVSWQRKGFRLFWSWSSKRKRRGRPEASSEIRALIRRMAEANPFWGAPRIHGELLKLGLEVSERTVSRLMPKSRKPPSQTWRAFLDNHLQELVAIDILYRPDRSVSGSVRHGGLGPSSSAGDSFQRHGTSDSSVDRAASSGSFSRRHSTAVPAPRPGSDRWKRVLPTSPGVGHHGSEDRTPEPRRSPEMTHPCSSKVTHVGNAIWNPFCDRKRRGSCNIGVLGMTVGGLKAGGGN